MTTETVNKYAPVTKQTIYHGMLLRQTWGCTMRHHNFYQVIGIHGARVFLTTPNCEIDGGQDGYAWIKSPTTDSTVTRHAKITASGLKLCRPIGETDWKGNKLEWKVERTWSTLYHQEIGEKEHYFGD